MWTVASVAAVAAFVLAVSQGAAAETRAGAVAHFSLAMPEDTIDLLNLAAPQVVPSPSGCYAPVCVNWFSK